MTDSVPKDPATKPGSQTADTATQFNKKSGKGLRHGVISELTTFFEVIPGHEDELRAACQRICRLGAGTRGPGAGRQGLAYQQTKKTAGSGNFFLFMLC